MVPVVQHSMSSETILPLPIKSVLACFRFIDVLLPYFEVLASSFAIVLRFATIQCRIWGLAFSSVSFQTQYLNNKTG